MKIIAANQNYRTFIRCCGYFISYLNKLVHGAKVVVEALEYLEVRQGKNLN